MLVASQASYPGRARWENWNAGNEFLVCGAQNGLWRKEVHRDGEYWHGEPVGDDLLDLPYYGNGTNVIHVTQDGSFPQFGIKKPLRRTVLDVTGIHAHSEAERLVEFMFRWTQDDLPPALRACLQIDRLGPFTGAATFRRYDDGWRVTAVD